MSIVKHAALLTTGTVIGQLIQLAALPLISFYAPPTIFGSYTLFVGFCAIAAVFSGLRYETAITVACTERQARMAVGLVSTFGFVSSGIIGVAALAISPWIPSLGGVSLLEFGIMAMMFLMLNTLVRTMSCWLNRLTHFGWGGGLQFATVAGMIALQVPLLTYGLNPVFALCLGHVGGQLSGFIVGICGPGREAFALNTFRCTSLLGTARHFIGFPKYMILYGLSTNLRERFIHAIVSWGAGPAALGHFAMAQRLESVPHSFMHGSIGPALVNYARQNDPRKVALVSCALIEITVLLLAPVFVFVAVNSDALIAQFFQPSWEDMHVQLRILAPVFLTLACTAFLDRLFELYGQQRVAMQVDLIYTAVMLSALILAALTGSSLIITLVFSIVFCIYSLVWTYITFTTNALSTDGLWRLSKRCAVYILSLLAVDIVVRVLCPLWLGFIAAAAVALFTFAMHWKWLGGRHLIVILSRT